MALPPQPARLAKAERRRFHPVVVAAIVVMLLAAFTFGYHRGADQRYRRQLTELRVEERRVKTAHEECKTRKNALLESRAKGDAEAEAEMSKLRRLEKELRDVREGNEALGQEAEECEAEATRYEERIAEQNEEDARLRNEVEVLRAKVDALHETMLTETAGEGREAVVARGALHSLRQQYVDWCSQSPGCVVKTNEELLEAYNAGAMNLTQAQSEMERYQRKAQYRLPPPLRPGDANFTDVYLDNDADHGDSSAASFFGRSVGEAVYKECTAKRGAGDDAFAMPASMSLSHQLTRLQDAALCAYRHHDDNVTFPSHFVHLQLDGSYGGEAYMHTLVTTPYVTFTHGCQEMETRGDEEIGVTTALACGADRIQMLYGGHSFWTMRSRVLPTKAIREQAVAFYDAQEFVGKPTLAVVLRRPHEGECEASGPRPPSLYLSYLQRAFPLDGAVNTRLIRSQEGTLSDDCVPTAPQIASAIQSLDRNVSSTYVAIILMMPRGLRDDVLLAVKGLGDLSLQNRIQFYEAPPQTNSAHAELVEQEIASMASTIVVSPYLTPSRYVTERFLLRNGLNPNGRVHFF